MTELKGRNTGKFNWVSCTCSGTASANQDLNPQLRKKYALVKSLSLSIRVKRIAKSEECFRDGFGRSNHRFENSYRDGSDHRSDGSLQEERNIVRHRLMRFRFLSIPPTLISRTLPWGPPEWFALQSGSCFPNFYRRIRYLP